MTRKDKFTLKFKISILLQINLFMIFSLLNPHAFSQPKTAKPKATEGVRASFESAHELYKAGKWALAATAFEQILRRYPGHQPTILLLAKTYYRQDRLKDAYPYFNKISLAGTDTETAYEYGYSFYHNKNYDGCLRGLKMIPEGHSLYDLAQYYLGVCNLKLKRYKDSEASFDRAMVLPDRLAKSRSLYLKHLDAILIHQEEERLAEERRQLTKKDPSKGENLAKGTQDPRTHPKKKPLPPPKPEGPPPYQGFKGPWQQASVKFESENQTIDYSGVRQEYFRKTGGSFHLFTAPAYFLPKSKDRFGSIGFTLGLEASSATIKGKQEIILLDERDESIQRNFTNTLPTKDEKKGAFSIEPWIEVPLPADLWGAVSVLLRMDYPEFERGQRSGTQQITMSLGGKHKSLGFGAQTAYTSLIDPENSPTTQFMGTQVHAVYDISSLMAVSGILRYENYNYPDPQKYISGADSVFRAEGDIVQSFPLGFSIRVAGMFDTEINKVFYDDPQNPLVAKSGKSLTGLGSIIYGEVPGGPPYPARSGRPPKILNFIDGAVTMKTRHTIWDIESNIPKDTFENAAPNFVEQIQAEFKVHLSF